MEEESYEIVIASYDRPNEIVTKSLAFLERQDIPKDKITIFVASDEERLRYHATCPDYKIVVGVLGLANCLNFIYDYFEKGQFILRLDDDIRDIKNVEGGSIDLKQNISLTHQIFQDQGINYGGFYSIFNKMFMENSNERDTCLRHIVGACNYFVNSEFRHRVGGGELHKEDYEKSLYHYKRDGKLLRYNHLGLITTYYCPKGGLSDQRNDANEKRGAEILKEMYPQWVNLFVPLKGKRAGKTQIRLREKKSK